MTKREKRERYLKARRNAKRRCNDPKNNRYQYYGAKGIKMLLTLEDILFIASRDQADGMKKPQLHRKKSWLNYTVGNCEFMEASLHSTLTHTGAKRSKEARAKMAAWPHLKGENHGQAKLTEDQVREIRVSSLSGISIAKKFGVRPVTVSAIRTGRNWKWLK